MACTARSKSLHVRAILLAAAVLLLAAPVHAARVEIAHLAYVDPGAGSFILQALVATIAGAAVAVSAYWRRIKRFLGIGSDDDETGSRERPPSDE